MKITFIETSNFLKFFIFNRDMKLFCRNYITNEPLILITDDSINTQLQIKSKRYYNVLRPLIGEPKKKKIN